MAFHALSDLRRHSIKIHVENTTTYEPCQTGILFVKHGARAPIIEVAAQILLHHDETPPLLLVPQRSMTPSEERDKIEVTQMAQTPLAPYHIKAHLNFIHRPHWLIPNTIEERSTVWLHRIKILYGSLQDRDAFSHVCDALPAWVSTEVARGACTAPG